MARHGGIERSSWSTFREALLRNLSRNACLLPSLAGNRPHARMGARAPGDEICEGFEKAR